MSFICWMDSGDMFCMAPAMFWNRLSATSLRSSSISSSNRWRASADEKS